MQTLENFVLGAWRRGEGRLAPLHDPTTGEAIAEAGTGGIDMQAVLAHARDVGGPRLRELTFAQRGALLAAASKAINEARDELIEIAIRNGGNTRKDAKFDIDGAWGTLFAYAEFAKRLGDTHAMLDGDADQLGRTPRFVSQHVLLPREGAAVHVNAFNFPGWGFAEKAACAWLAGMPVVTKPATATAMLAERIVRILAERKVLPEGALQLLCGSTGDLLDHLGPQDVLAFTGSAETGLKLRSRENLLRWSVRVNVEADSLNAAVLGPDVTPSSEHTWQLFVNDVVRDVTQKAGQKCTAIRRVLVPAAQADAVVSELSSRLGAVKVGNPALNEVGMGPLSTADQKADVLAGIGKLAKEADLVHGSTAEPALVGAEKGRGWFVGPVLLRTKDAKSALAVHEHEVFGPCATVLPYDGSAEEAVALVRKGMGGLVSSWYSDDREWVRRAVLGAGPWHGRLYLGSAKMADQSLGPGTVLPASVHGGPGRAGGGEELGLPRGMALYQQRVALQGDRAVIERMFPRPGAAPPA